MRIYLHSIGCRLNQSEIETMGRQLLAQGHEIVADAGQADKVIINTCAVTAEAARDARAQTRRIHRANAAAEILLTGCYATIAPEELAQVEGAGPVVVNRDKPRLVQLIDPAIDVNAPVYDREPLLREFAAGAAGNTRAFVKVQDGCKNRCTFCVTTVARGDSVSRHAADVVAEIQALAQAGYQEAVLSGVHLGSYGHDLGRPAGLRDLVRLILTHTDIPRLRLSSLEPWDIAPDFFALWENPRLLPHLHLPLQSGSDPILRLMARRTTRADFRALVDEARAAIPDLSLSTDLIVGFPGETEAHFRASLDYVAEMAFSRLHVFTYSPRPATAAARMPAQVAKAEKKARTREMIALGEEMGLAFHRRYEGGVRAVLWEQAVAADERGLIWRGYSDNYIRVEAHGPADLLNRVTPVRLGAATAQGMGGAVLLDAEAA